MKIVIITFILIFCSLTTYCFWLEGTRPRVDKVGNDLTFRFSKKMFQKKRYYSLIKKSIPLDGKIRKITLHFDSEETFTLSEARQLICDLSTDFLLFINEEHKKYQQDYIDYPLKTCNINLRLFFKGHEAKPFHPKEDITLSSLGITYRGDSKEAILKDGKLIEPLEEAIEKLEAEGKNYDYLKSMISYKKYDCEEKDDIPYQILNNPKY